MRESASNHKLTEQSSRRRRSYFGPVVRSSRQLSSGLSKMAIETVIERRKDSLSNCGVYSARSVGVHSETCSETIHTRISDGQCDEVSEDVRDHLKRMSTLLVAHGVADIKLATGEGGRFGNVGRVVLE